MRGVLRAARYDLVSARLELAKAKETSDKVMKDAKKALKRDMAKGKPRLDRLRERERFHRGEIDDLVKQLQREEERLSVSETDENVLDHRPIS